MPRHLFVVLILLLASLPGQAGEVTILSAARIHSFDQRSSEATAIAWDDSGRILALGDRYGLKQQFPHARQIKAKGATVIPGLIDAHGHLMGLGMALLRADLVGTAGKAEILDRLKTFERTLPAGAWLLGRGWDQNDWPEKVYPSAADLDAAFPDRPVWLERIDGHAGWANSAAMRAAGKDFSGDWQPAGGRIERSDGQASGVFVDNAAALIEAALPAPDAALRRSAIQRALAQAVAQGLTGVHDMGVSRADLALYRELADAKQLPLRITAYADGDAEAFGDLCRDGRYWHAGGRLGMPGVKLYIDGALGSRGAALQADYSDAPGQRGLLVTAPDVFEKLVARAHACGLQVASHAIGDRGNQVVLDTYASVLGKRSQADHRYRIEHAQVVTPNEIPRFARLGLIASMQPTHATSDMPWAEARLGAERLAGAYAWQQFRAAGVRLALGSDFPVELSDPRLGLYAAVSRQDRLGQPAGGWLPAERLSIEQALHGFTDDAAYAGFAETEVGELSPGHRADFVLLDADPLTVPAAQLPALAIRSTWVDGQVVYQAGKRP
ncbi:MAG: amidohydrolase [Gammaproteobacteria bacterium]